MKVSSKGSFSQARLIAPPSLARSFMGSPLQTTSSQKADLFFLKTSTFTHLLHFTSVLGHELNFPVKGYHLMN